MSGAGTPEPDEGDGRVLPRPGLAPSASGQAGLARVVARMSGPVFAVVDGGHFADLPALLAGAGLAARSLFLGHGEREAERSGPWLVPVAGEADAARVLGLVGDLPAVVFWSCPAGDVELYGHLRRLNMAQLPVWAAAGKEGPEPGVEADLGWEAVLFRHWDPSVLGALLPVLDEGQFARVLGPAGELAFFAEDYGGTKRVVADPDWPVQPPGMLTITAEQVGALTERRVEAQRRRIVAYLREVTGGELAGASDADVRAHVLHCEAGARELGLVTEGGRCRWAYLVYATRGQVAREPELIRLIRHGDQVPDAQIEGLMDAAIRALKHEQQAATSGRRA